MAIELRRVCADDWETWRPVRLAALTEAPGAFGSTLEDWVDAPEARWRARLSIPGAVDLVAVEADRDPSVPDTAPPGRDASATRNDGATRSDGATHPVGLASGIPGDEPGTAELISMWVDPAVRGRGVATMLVSAVASWAVQAGATVLELSVMPDDTDARRVYERCGFVAVDEPGDVLPDGRHEVVMRLDLTADRTLDAYERASDLYTARTDDHRAGLVDDLLGLVPSGSHVLELGSGPGRDALALEAAGLRVDRTDGARAFVDALRADGHEARVLDLRADTFGGPYDAVFANAVLLHVARAALPGVLARLLVAVRPGGVLAATLKRGAGDAWSTRKTDRARHFTYWTEDDLTEVVTRAGWDDVVVRETTRAGAAERWLTVTARRAQGAGPG